MLNAAFFYNDYQNLQVFRFVPDPNTGVPAASARVRGVELELHARPVAPLDLQAGMSYLDAKYQNYLVQAGDATAGSPPVDYSGNQLVGAPRLHVNGAAE